MKKQIDWEKFGGEQVQIYRNLANHLISVQAYIKGKGWRVIGHTDQLTLIEVKFVVNESKRQYILNKRKKRDVCAVAQGILLSPQPNEECLIEVDFNPFLYAYFYEKGSHRALGNCQFVSVRENVVRASEDALLNAQTFSKPSLQEAQAKNSVLRLENKIQRQMVAAWV